jgi:hypothetical protein
MPKKKKKKNTVARDDGWGNKLTNDMRLVVKLPEALHLIFPINYQV